MESVKRHMGYPTTTIIDINYAKHITSIWMARVNQVYGGIENMPNVMESHKKILRYRTKILLDR